MAIKVLTKPTYGFTLEVTTLSVGIAEGEKVWWVGFNFWPGEVYGVPPTLGGLCAGVGSLLTLALDSSWPVEKAAA